MKTLMFILCATMTSYAQVVTLNFKSLDDLKMKSIIQDNIYRFNKNALLLNDADSVEITYNVSNNCIVLSHNITDPFKIKTVNKGFMMLCSFIKGIYPINRFNRIRVFTEYDDSRYLVTNYKFPKDVRGPNTLKWFMKKAL